MPGPTTPLFALLFALAVFPARAENPPLDGSYEVAPSPEPAVVPDPDNAYSERATPDDYVPPSPTVVIHAHESPRFNSDERSRLRTYLMKLCREDAVAPQSAARVKGRTTFTARNKQGSLVLLLDNYGELAALHEKCEAARKKNPLACIEKGRMPKPGSSQDLAAHPALTVGSSQFWTDVSTWRSPAGIEHKTDLVRESDAQLKSLKELFKKEFFDVRDLADISAKPDGATFAKKLAATVRSESTCGTRAVAERFQK